MIRTRNRLWLCFCLLAVNLAFIWGNSLLPGEISGAISGSVRNLLAAIFPAGTDDPDAGHGLLRKLAHFTEFCTLGMLFSWLYRMLLKKPWQHITFPFICGVLAACVDETIQCFVPDRGPGIKDVGIDILGVTLGIVIIYFSRKIKKIKIFGGTNIMKKLIALLLVLTMAMGLVACGNTDKTPATTTEATTEATTGDEGVTPEGGDIDLPLDNTPAASNGASEVLSNIWNKVPEDKKFFTMGGDMNNMVDGNAGVYSLEDEGLTATLLVPADQIANIDAAASLVHGMMLNNFTAGMFHVTGDAAAFATAMYNAISTNPWMCGMPEKLIIAVINGEYVLSCFGINDAVSPFETALTAAYADADVKYNEAITG